VLAASGGLATAEPFGAAEVRMGVVDSGPMIAILTCSPRNPGIPCNTSVRRDMTRHRLDDILDVVIGDPEAWTTTGRTTGRDLAARQISTFMTFMASRRGASNLTAARRDHRSTAGAAEPPACEKFFGGGRYMILLAERMSGEYARGPMRPTRPSIVTRLCPLFASSDKGRADAGNRHPLRLYALKRPATGCCATAGQANCCEDGNQRRESGHVHV